MVVEGGAVATEVATEGMRDILLMLVVVAGLSFLLYDVVTLNYTNTQPGVEVVDIDENKK